ncbi:hypothetical protein RGU12_01910 [Fredinandcohnia sp. QZ13]|uniref:hypothetical protein n=1 Tax=Fredinandcohnia sp. QZ13 TaxID=3073144 RepID=UPI00285366DA|nr:hypothetical protein [Fredinandcohnia sp. QZ13]MDR4886299.1 hypothetical protein [Fredinandcohnia sp. QZ13]
MTEWYTTEEVAKLINRNASTLRKHARTGLIPDSFLKSALSPGSTKYLIHASYVEQQLSLQAKLSNDYYKKAEVKRMLNVSDQTLKILRETGVFEDVLLFETILYFSKKEVDKYINRKTSAVSIVKLIKEEFNVSTDRHALVNFIFNDPLLSKLVYKEAQSYQIKIEDWEEYKKGLVDVEGASRYLNMPLEVMQMLWRKKHIKSFTANAMGVRTHLAYLDEYKQRGLIPIEQLALEMNTSLSVIRKFFTSDDYILLPDNKKDFYIKREKADELINSYAAIQIKHNYNNHLTETNYNQFFEDSIIYFKNKANINLTVDLYNRWARKKIEKSTQPLKKITLHYLLVLEVLATQLTKELMEYTDLDLKQLFESLPKNQTRRVTQFLDYCKEKVDCAFSGDYVFKKTLYGDYDEAYTKEEWKMLILHVLDVNKHFENAVKNREYANIWLFCLLHFSLAWRRSDMFSFKPISLEIVGIDDFEWFNEHTFKLEDAQNILKTVERSMQEYLSRKNEQKIVFVVPFIFEMPTALAFILSELHRKKENVNSEILVKNISDKNINDFFGKDLPKFKSKMSNKSLMTYGWETAVKNGKGVLAYWLSGFSRSHTHKIAMPNSITQVYLVTRNTDVDVEEMARHAFDRGIFGWQVKVMIDAINENEPMSLEEMTTAITNINEEYSPVMINELSRFAVTRHEQSIALLKDLMKIPKQELKDKLKEISRLRSPSLLDHSQCLVGLENCPFKKEVEYNLEMPCLGCKNRIDTNYILDIVNVKIFSLIERLKKTNQDEHITRMKYTHMIKSLLYILMDFKRMYDQFDTNYIRSFIDLELLRSNIRELNVTKFLTIDEANN